MASWYKRRPMPTAMPRQSVSQLFMVGLPGPRLDRATRAFLTDHPPGGVILFKRNIRSAAELRRLAEAIHATGAGRSEEHTSELQSQSNLVCRLLLEKKTHYMLSTSTPA